MPTKREAATSSNNSPTALPPGRAVSSWELPLPAAGGHLSLSSKPLVMGVVNITPDSFSDGGLFFESSNAVDHGLKLVHEGADILDLGAESTRPGGGVYGSGCVEVGVQDELRRLLPVLQALRRELPQTPLSVDTRKGEVARQALSQGADLINDVGGLADPDLVAAAAAANCPVIAMHSRGQLHSMQRGISFDDVISEVYRELEQYLQRADDGGLSRDLVILDPGIGFGKSQLHNLSLIGGLDRFADLGRPLLLGASRKSFISTIDPSPPDKRLGGSLAAVAWAAQTGASLVRVHDVALTAQFLKVWNAIDSERY